MGSYRPHGDSKSEKIFYFDCEIFHKNVGPSVVEKENNNMRHKKVFIQQHAFQSFTSCLQCTAHGNIRRFPKSGATLKKT